MTPLVAVVAVAAPVTAQDTALDLRTLSGSGESSVLAVEMHLRARIGKPAAGHEYRFKYQFRLHTKTGEIGPLLGNAAAPQGAAFDLGPLVKPAGAGWAFDTPSAPPAGKTDVEAAARTLEFDGRADVTRKDLSGMTNLPKDARNVVVRVEPHVYDATDGKYVTPAKTDAVLLVVETGPAGQVWAVRTFEDWFPRQFGTKDAAAAATRLVDEVDAWDRYYAVTAGFERVLADPDVKPALKAVAVHGKSRLPQLLTTLAGSADADLKAAAADKLAAAEKKK
ncbi:MAG: hypothetical protein JWO38_7741 [Gemmataceae bacterium]|nr:hypothetical protein [Gemmataceae bacterium]